MRTPLLAGLVGLLLPACVVGAGEITGIGDGDEIGDDGERTGTGTGDGNGGGDGTVLTPRVAATLDNSVVVTENGKTETITVTLSSVGGFAGDVTLTPQLVDETNASFPQITVTGPSTINLAAGETAAAAYQLAIPTNATGVVIEASFNVNLSSSAGTESVSSAVTINNVYTVDYPSGTGTSADNHPNAKKQITIARGTIIRFPNNDTITHIIHGAGPFDHENNNGGTPGRTYEVPTIGVQPGTSGTLGCHSHGSGSYGTYTVM